MNFLSGSMFFRVPWVASFPLVANQNPAGQIHNRLSIPGPSMKHCLA